MSSARSVGVVLAAVVAGAAVIGGGYLACKAWGEANNDGANGTGGDSGGGTTPTGTTTPKLPDKSSHSSVNEASKAERLLLQQLTKGRSEEHTEAILNALDGSNALRSETESSIRQTIFEFSFDQQYDPNQILSGLQTLDRQWDDISQTKNDFFKASRINGALQDGALAAAF